MAAWERNGRNGPLDWWIACEQHDPHFSPSCLTCQIVIDHNGEFQQKLASENAPMPQSSKEKQEAFRARNAMLGRTEVRGIFLPPELHAVLKDYAKSLAQKRPAPMKSKP